MAEISTIARPYAQAVFDLAKEQSQLQVWSDTLSLLSHVVEDEAVKSVINDSKLLDTDKEKLILDICKKNINNIYLKEIHSDLIINTVFKSLYFHIKL